MSTCRNFCVYLHEQKWTLFVTSFLRYCKDIANSLLSVLRECFLIMPINNDSITLQETLQETLKPKVLKSTSRKLWCLSACTKSFSSLTSFLRHCKYITNSLFLELWECLIISIKIIVSICSKLPCLSTWKKSTLSLTSLSRY